MSGHDRVRGFRQKSTYRTQGRFTPARLRSARHRPGRRRRRRRYCRLSRRAGAAGWGRSLSGKRRGRAIGGFADAKGRIGGQKMIRHSDRAIAFMAKWPAPGRSKTRTESHRRARGRRRFGALFPARHIGRGSVQRRRSLDRLCSGFERQGFRETRRSRRGPAPRGGDELRHGPRADPALPAGAGVPRVALVARTFRTCPRIATRMRSPCWLTPPSCLGRAEMVATICSVRHRATPHLFHAVAWSTETVFTTTVRRAREAVWML